MIIVVLGRAGSGKSVVSKHISNLLDIPLIETSDVVKFVLDKQKSRGIDRGAVNLEKDAREKENPDWLWEYLGDAITDCSGSCVVSGLREPYLLHKILDMSSDTFVIGLDVTPFVRYSRLCKRDGFISVKDFRLTDDGTSEDRFIGDNTLGLDITFTRADVLIDGNKSADEVKADVLSALFDRGIVTRNKQGDRKHG